MTGGDDIDGLAAEYVLGTLDSGERATVALRRLREPLMDAAIILWERRLAPLAELVNPVEPPLGMLNKIMARLARRGALSGEVIELQKSRRRWRIATVAASALAASLALVISVREAMIARTPTTFVAVLQKDAASPAFLLTVDIGNRMLSVRPVAAGREPGKSYELWLVHDSLKAPRSLGVIPDSGIAERPVLNSYEQGVVTNATYAVSLEPEGGSPTGAPTGPVVFTGKLVQATK